MLVPDTDRRYHTHVLLGGTFNAAECREIVALGEASAASEAAVQDGAGRSADTSLRRARVGWIPPRDDSDWIFERLAAAAARANDVYRFELAGFTEDLQFTTYGDRGAFYTWHQDGLDGAVAGRKLSLVVQLTDPSTYEGSTLEFLDVVEDYAEADREVWHARARRRGTVVAFPAFEYHRVTPLVSGIRHSLVCWIGGPPFR